MKNIWKKKFFDIYIYLYQKRSIENSLYMSNQIIKVYKILYLYYSKSPFRCPKIHEISQFARYLSKKIIDI